MTNQKPTAEQEQTDQPLQGQEGASDYKTCAFESAVFGALVPEEAPS